MNEYTIILNHDELATVVTTLTMALHDPCYDEEIKRMNAEALAAILACVVTDNN